jgi:probable phosphoglycerate mutase
MLRIYLARHGQDEDNEKGVLNGRRNRPLTKLGVKQAKQLALKIERAGIIFDKVYSSPLQRANKTAMVITDELGLEKPEKLDNLIERDFGKFSGILIGKAALASRPNTLITRTVEYILEPEGGETFPDLLRRSKKVLKFITSRHKKGNVLLVTHGDIGKMIYAQFYGLKWKEVLNGFHFGNSELLLLSTNTKPQDISVFKTKQSNL